ncbi:helix-turn-helix transcriptional regulator [Thalassiella azotivora]
MDAARTVAVEIRREPGPAPVRSGGRTGALSPQRARVLEHLQCTAEQVTVAGLAADTGLHENTVREHLDDLVARGLVVRDRVPSRRRGRPAWGYTAVAEHGEPDDRVRDHAGLATALAGHIARTSPNPRQDALTAGRQWGRDVAAGDGPAPGPHQARHRVVALMRDLGFDPQTDARATTVALRRCPLLDTARAHPDVVCAVHLGLVQGALEAWGGDPARTALTAFAEPGACRLLLRTDRPVDGTGRG